MHRHRSGWAVFRYRRQPNRSRWFFCDFKCKNPRFGTQFLSGLIVFSWNGGPLEKNSDKRRSEKAGLLNFTREMASALLMAFVAIVYVIQAFKIPTGSMERSLLVGDFLLGLKFIYGAPVLPFAYTRFPGVTDPEPGDVIIFEYPGSDFKDYIKRCVAGPGQTVEIHGRQVLVDGEEVALPPRGQYIQDGRLIPEIADFEPLRIPARGDTLTIAELPIREFLYAKHIIKQENPRSRFVKFLESNFLTRGIFSYHPSKERVKLELQLYVDGEFANDRPLETTSPFQRALTFADINANPRLNAIDKWPVLERDIEHLHQRAQQAFPGSEIRIVPMLLLDGKRVTEYVVKYDNYFMMGDNRDNSLDSRFWGFVNRRYVKAKAFIIYFSWADVYRDGENNIKMYRTARGKQPKEIPSYLLPLKIRWGRIGKLIRAWTSEDAVTATVRQSELPASPPAESPTADDRAAATVP
ncbi:MAG: signal peptidase I [Chitinivibrionales bacterium]|nr:signal peptidase I [Chitinivibrionales bacterium]MBD3359014.1 signal peptidase I [Chitinivibrionales bacterium]